MVLSDEFDINSIFLHESTPQAHLERSKKVAELILDGMLNLDRVQAELLHKMILLTSSSIFEKFAKTNRAKKLARSLKI
jgi:hypothetical protein